MSKKNSKSKRKSQLAFDLRREREAQKQREKQRSKGGTEKPKHSVQKSKRRGIRIRKGVVVKGIKIRDAASKEKALSLLRAEQAMREMEVDEKTSEVERME